MEILQKADEVIIKMIRNLKTMSSRIRSFMWLCPKGCKLLQIIHHIFKDIYSYSMPPPPSTLTAVYVHLPKGWFCPCISIRSFLPAKYLSTTAMAPMVRMKVLLVVSLQVGLIETYQIRDASMAMNPIMAPQNDTTLHQEETKNSFVNRVTDYFQEHDESNASVRIGSFV